jgi:hypothetical protein
MMKAVVALLLLAAANAFSVVPSPRVARVGRLSAGPSLEYNPDKFKDEANSGNFRKLSDKLKDGDIERKKAEEEALQRENALEFARLARQKKIDFMKDMPDNTPAGKVRL